MKIDLETFKRISREAYQGNSADIADKIAAAKDRAAARRQAEADGQMVQFSSADDLLDAIHDKAAEADRGETVDLTYLSDAEYLDDLTEPDSYCDQFVERILAAKQKTTGKPMTADELQTWIDRLQADLNGQQALDHVRLKMTGNGARWVSVDPLWKRLTRWLWG